MNCMTLIERCSPYDFKLSFSQKENICSSTQMKTKKKKKEYIYRLRPHLFYIYFPVKKKFGLVSMKVFSFYFERKTLPRSCEKFRNVILFANYIKFDPQNF